MNEIYHKLVDLRNMYGIVLDYISTEIIELIKVEDLNERERKVTSIRKSENKINKEAKEKFLDIFKKYKETGMQKGFRYVASAPFVRSSYNAAEAVLCGSL